MSIAEFSTALKNKAIKEWFNTEKGARASYRQENVNVLVNATGDYRSAEQTAAKTSFVITKNTVRDLLVDTHGEIPGSERLEELTNVYFASFGARNAGAQVNRRKINIEGTPAIYFSSISFVSITNLVNNILNLKSGELSKKYEKGHVVGLNTELLRVTANRISGIDARGARDAGSAKEVLLRELSNVIDYYKRLDFASANIQPASDVKVYASVNKTINKSGTTKYLVELQTKAANQRSADEVKATIGSIRKLFDPGALTEKQMVSIITKLIPSVSDPKFTQDLINMRSSPSFLDMMATQIADSIVGNTKSQVVLHTNVLVATKLVPKVNLSNLRKVVQAEKLKVEALKQKLQKKVPPIRTTQGQFYSLNSLQALMDKHLQDVIAANMGDGGSRNVLNYRTGRFAASAKVERLSQSREGMITAFYSYMKNPYQTFEPGYKQGSPKTRDPKLLIGKSIKEIAATVVGNRMRVILV